MLCTGNERLGRLAAGLESLGLPVLYLGSLFERDEIQELLSLLSTLIDRRAMGLVRIATMPHFRISLSEVETVIRHLKEAEEQPVEWLGAIDGIADLSQDARESLARLRDALQGFDSRSAPWPVLAAFLLDRTKIAAEISNSEGVSDRARGVAIWQFMNFVRSQPSGPGLPARRLLDRIRRLVLLSDERDLRELPAAAQGIDAVRLMTIHGSKGLEFRAVHIPGMNADTLPRSPNHVRGCPPPDRMVEGVDGTGIEVLKAGHVEEQECLFFVALSRARDRLLLYSPTLTANGRTRARSPFVDRLSDKVEHGSVRPRSSLRIPADDVPVPIGFPAGIRLTDHKLGLYERCPRRFLYTHMLEVGGRRTETPFMRMHGAVRAVIDWLIESASAPSPAEVDSRLAKAWDENGLDDQGYSGDFERIARQLIRYFVECRSGYGRLPATDMRLVVPGGEIVVTPDEVLTARNGRKHVRSVRTGHAGSKDLESVPTAVFALAAEGAFPGCTVELVHLGDAAVNAVSMKPRMLANRREAAVEVFEEIRAGRFPRKESTRTCPRCPAFFICGPVPGGPLEKKFEK